MKRTLVYAVVTLLVLSMVLVVGGRLALGSLVASEEFRTRFNDLVERSLRTVLPSAMTELKATRLAGLATLELEGLTVTSSKDVTVTLQVPLVHLKPSLLSLLTGQDVTFDGDATVGEEGHVTLSGAVPRAALKDNGDGPAGTVTVQSAYDHLNAAMLVALLFPEKSGPNIRLTNGTATGTLQVSRSLGRHDGRHKTGQALVHLGETKWTSTTATEKTVTLPAMDLDLALEDFVVQLKSPVTLTERTGRTTVAGALLLPERAERAARWDLDVAVAGDTGLAGSLAKLLRCTAPAPGPHFHVEGPVGAPSCPPG